VFGPGLEAAAGAEASGSAINAPTANPVSNRT
jgi:hypothetical protein